MTMLGTPPVDHSIHPSANSPVNSNLPNQSTLSESIRTFVLEKFPACRSKGLQNTDSLIDSGIIDSMGILELVAFVESDFGIVVEDMDLTPENFESIAALSAFVAGQQNG